MAVTVRPIEPGEHQAYVDSQPSVHHLHTPQWAATKAADQAVALGFFTDDAMVGVGVVQFLRTVAGRRSAYLPQGPVVAWDKVNPGTALAALEGWLRRAGCYEARIGPSGTWHTWSNETLKAALADEADSDLRQLPPDATDPVLTTLAHALPAHGWSPAAQANTNDAQNAYNFHVAVDRPLEEVRGRLNQMYRRNIKKAEKGGVVVEQGGASLLPTFHRLYRASGEREGFFVLGLDYFTTQFAAWEDDPEHVRVFVARLGGEPLAASVWLKVGDHVWYTFGGSADAHRELRAVNLLQWAMIEASHEAGAVVYDMGGIYPNIDKGTRGLLQFKVGTGGHGVGSVNEWSKTFSPAHATAARLADGAAAAVRRVMRRG